MGAEAETFDFQTIVILSYREEYRVVHHGDIYASHVNDSSVGIYTAQGVNQAATWIVARLREDPRAKFGHVLFMSWTALTQYGVGGRMPALSQAGHEYGDGWHPNGQSIESPFEVDYDDEDWDDLNEEEEVTARICARVHDRVRELLAEFPPNYSKRGRY